MVQKGPRGDGLHGAVPQRWIQHTIVQRVRARVWMTALLAVSLTVFATPSCSGGEPELSIDEVIKEGRRCLQPVIEARSGSLQIEVGALNNCFAKLMADEQGRFYLLGAGNAALVNWARDVATDVGENLSADSVSGLGETVEDASEELLIRDEATDLRVLYGSLVRGLRANIKQPEAAAAELSGVLSVLDDEATRPHTGGGNLAAAGEHYVRDDLRIQVQGSIDRRKTKDREKFKKGATFLMEDEIEDHLMNMLAVVLWAEGRIRSKILSGPVLPGERPGSPPPTNTPEGQVIEPSLGGADGALRIPGPDEQPAHKLFFDWLERGGGVQLLGATSVVLSRTGLEESFRDLAERVYARD